MIPTHHEIVTITRTLIVIMFVILNSTVGVVVACKIPILFISTGAKAM